jgi:hypothetical protein
MLSGFSLWLRINVRGSREELEFPSDEGDCLFFCAFSLRITDNLSAALRSSVSPAITYEMNNHAVLNLREISCLSPMRIGSKRMVLMIGDSIPPNQSRL